jgi:polyhydroxybutyrate depolymerase
MHIHSVDDPRALYGGGLATPYPLTTIRIFHQPVDDMLQRWAEHDGCPREPRISRPVHGAKGDERHTATRYSYGPCRDATKVVLWKLTGAGHVWPGGQRDYLPLLLGTSSSVIDANEEMWRFFSRFRRQRQ